MNCKFHPFNPQKFLSFHGVPQGLKKGLSSLDMIWPDVLAHILINLKTSPTARKRLVDVQISCNIGGSTCTYLDVFWFLSFLNRL